MPGDTTHPTAPPARTGAARRDPEVPALVVADCRAEPWRVGEVAFFPDLGIETIVGRGRGTGREVRAVLCQQRPTGTVPQPPLAHRSLSRALLEVTAVPIAFDLGLRVSLLPAGERRREMRVNGEVQSTWTVRSGDTIEIRGEQEGKLLFYCTTRPMNLRTRYPHADGWAPFGEADRHGIVGESPARWALRERLIFAAKARLHVLLRGPSGAGKELAARALHELSKRAGGPFVSRNAATFTESLIAAELFGNVANFPNPETPARPGLFGEANHGTLFLDEIGEMPEWLQSRLLRATDPHGEYTSVGASKPSRCDVWVIVATNRDLSALKHDLAGRLKTRVELPGLNERREDIPLLVQHLALGFAEKNPELAERFVFEARGKKYARVDPSLVDVLMRWTYTTHVRELDTLLTTAIAESEGETIELYPGLAEMLEEQILARVEGMKPERKARAAASPQDEERMLRLLCDGKRGWVARAARALGMTRQQIYRRLEKYGIAVPEGGDGGQK